MAALRFFFVRTLRRPEFREFLPYPRDRRRLPDILSLDEVTRLLDAASNLFRRALLMTLYGTGMRRSEVAHLQVQDVDSQRMLIRVNAGKGGKSRDLPLSPALLETLPRPPCHIHRCTASSNRVNQAAPRPATTPAASRASGGWVLPC